MSSPPGRQLPMLLTLLGACLISVSAVWVKLAQVEPAVSSFYRVFFGACFLLLATVWRGDLRLPARRQCPWILLCGLIFALDLYCWHGSIRYIGPGLATIIGNFQVFILTAIGFFFSKEQLRLRFLLAIPIAITGLFLVIELPPRFNLHSASLLGLILGLLTALCYSGFLLSLKKIQSDEQHHSFFYNLLLISLVTALFLALFMVATNTSFALPSLTAITSLLCLGLFSQTIGWALIAHAMPKMRTSLTGMILLLQPALSFVWDVLLFGRPTTLENWLGVGLTLTAIYMGMTGKQKLSTSTVIKGHPKQT
ncbi:DMT family transporter [Desulfogranum mediterraneum]|uniref:DMT family transporter n=1 Tax=Desulfogranum mediterraneum TaxID=160661 RepID=UPI0004101051|nr:DMT family transporter [Desulfogranum mediterraneum]